MGSEWHRSSTRPATDEAGLSRGWPCTAVGPWRKEISWFWLKASCGLEPRDVYGKYRTRSLFSRITPWKKQSLTWLCGQWAMLKRFKFTSQLCFSLAVPHWATTSPLRAFAYVSTSEVDVVHVLTRVWLSATPWTIAHQAPLSMGILQAWILEWVAMPSSKGSSRPKDQTHIFCVSCIGRRILFHYCHLFCFCEVLHRSETLTIAWVRRKWRLGRPTDLPL